jgi:very-short-patch-repair endonuclease
MTKRKEHIEFRCSKCKVGFRGVDSFHGEYRISIGGVTKIQLCMKCLNEMMAVWNGECNYLRGHIEKEIESCTKQHVIDKCADAKRTAFEKVLDLMDNSTMFNGYNERSGYGRDLSSTELAARRIVHGENKINFEEQIGIRVQGYRCIVDGLIPIGRKQIVLEFDSDYWHRTEEQKERDSNKDSILVESGYKVVRVSEQIIKNDKSQFKTLLLDALFDVKRSTKRREELSCPVATEDI